MSEVEFTKGPWVSVDGNTSGREVLAEKATKAKTRVARCGGPDRDANAHLIAAAPELYEALETLTEMARRMDFSEGVCCCGDSVEGHGFGSGHSPVDAGLYYATEAIETALTALAKARGETP